MAALYMAVFYMAVYMAVLYIAAFYMTAFYILVNFIWLHCPIADPVLPVLLKHLSKNHNTFLNVLNSMESY